MKSVWIKSCAYVLMIVPVLAIAANFKAGVHYTELDKPVATQTGDKIEVLEFFWYGCPHCFRFEPVVSRWGKNTADNVRFIRVPAPLNPKWMVHTKTYYALEMMDKLDLYHEAIFDAMHVKRKRLYTLDAIADFLANQGLDPNAFKDTYNSFGVEMRARQAMQLGRDYQLNGVPMLTVNGKYVISASKAGGYQKMLDIADYLIEREAKAADPSN